ncbi:hypothetical protein [Streptacidiphilus sp. MAP5-3]|uniref:hypothetical protein n=1 Tax=Streptacidiphilus sp. MAP5-3 TaxID=3156265 RepID=UPI0035198502
MAGGDGHDREAVAVAADGGVVVGVHDGGLLSALLGWRGARGDRLSLAGSSIAPRRRQRLCVVSCLRSERITNAVIASDAAVMATASSRAVRTTPTTTTAATAPAPAAT